MSDILIESAKQVPALVALVVLVVVIIRLFLAAEDKREAQRIANDKQLETERSTNAKALEEMRQKHESQTIAMLAEAIKHTSDEFSKTAKMIIDALDDHEEKSKDRYQKMNITKDLLEAAKDREREQRTGRKDRNA